MKINYHGHSCFTVVLENGASLLLDPYNGSVGYPLVERKADVVTCSHHHGDHHYLENIVPGYRLVEGTDPVTVIWSMEAALSISVKKGMLFSLQVTINAVSISSPPSLKVQSDQMKIPLSRKSIHRLRPPAVLRLPAFLKQIF